MESPLTTYRKANDLTLEQFGESFGVNKSTVLRWEEGAIPAERVLSLEKATGVSRHDLRPDLYPRESHSRPAPREGEAA